MRAASPRRGRRLRATGAVLAVTLLATGCSTQDTAGPAARTSLPSTSQTPLPPRASSATASPSTTTGASTSSSTTVPTRTRTSTAPDRPKDWSGTTGLDRDLARALVRARQDTPAGVRLRVNSGFRPAAQQQRLWEAEIRKRGSRREARKWVLPPQDSSHVSGDAVDIAPREGAAWLERHGVEYGLCRTYRNEWWHFEHVARDGRCPPMYRDAAAAAAAGRQ